MDASMILINDLDMKLDDDMVQDIDMCIHLKMF